uniref:NECAP PHear domain-containing protein n=1 Tax=Haptolina brevifila TaxID=156173 RepID=A0A7S2MR18_9EUKA|mmetsp:Transcript_56946/g.113151  ORF Transcript_56946/g.113151 Transcript_56946/m.113151 type:complete len:279 (+) Transcript_56946:116-952(+)
MAEGRDDCAAAESIETLLWTCKEAYVYQIPPLKNESGHRANDWDVNKWLWQGALKVTATGERLNIVLHDPSTGELFANCPVTEQGSKAVDQVIDSSRYFALRIDDGKGKHAFVGMGFRDRAYAYDFNATMQDHWKGIERQKEADRMAAETAARASSEPARDYSLKQGEMLNIKVNVPGAGSKPRAPKPKPAEGSSFALPPPPGTGLLAPPPKAGALAPPPPPTASVAPAPATAPAAAATAAAASAEDEFGAFGDFKAVEGTGDDDDDDGFGDFSSASK